MKPQKLVVATAMALLCWLGSSAWAQSKSDPPWSQDAMKPAARLAAKPLPKLAVVTVVQEITGPDRENIEDLLLIELGHQPFLQLVDRQALQTVMKEHAIALTNPGDASSAIALGKFAGADYLLYILIEKDKLLPTQRKATVCLVEVATGQVKLQQEVKLAADLELFAASIREKILAILRPESEVHNYLTVGITEFPNRSGNQLSDKLSIELQTALRKRLTEQSWATVLERQYPTVLLDERDLARAGLTKTNDVGSLPPADLVIFGSLEDAGRQYEPGKPWQVVLRLMVRLRGHSQPIEKTCRSDQIEAAADELMKEIDQFRQEQPKAESDVPEVELWRRQALYLMPRLVEYWPQRKNALIPHFERLSDVNKRELIRAWENVLLLDPDNAEAMTYLGACLIGFDTLYFNTQRPPDAKRAAIVAQWMAASRLLQRAVETEPTPDRAVTYVYSIRVLMTGIPTRAKEMAQYALDHPEVFKGFSDFAWIKVALTRILPEDEHKKFGELERALANAEKDPNAVLILFPPGLTRNGPVETYTALLAPYLDSPDPVAQFVAQRAMGEMLCWVQKDPAGLEHLDRAIAVAEAAYQRGKDEHRVSVDAIYRLKIDACGLFDRPEEAKKTAVAGGKHFMEVGRFFDWHSVVDFIYRYCVTKALGPDQDELALKICDTYIAEAKKYWQRYDGWPDVCAKREEVTARLAGKPVPDMKGLRLVTGAGASDLMWMRMAATEGKLWCVPGRSGNGDALFYDPDRNEVSRLLNNEACSVAATRDAVFFGGRKGLYEFDTNGKLLKHYEGKDASLPGDYIFDACAGAGKIYFSFLGSPQPGVAVLDPASDGVTVLAPSSRDAKREDEPIAAVRRLQWDAITPRLYAGVYYRYNNNLPLLAGLYGWSPQDRTWQLYPLNEAPRLVVSDGNETLLVRVLDDHCEFHFVKADQTVKAVVPVPTHIGEPAWDLERIWVPTASGLYEVDRATGQVKWLAYEANNRFFSLLKADGRLYVATSRGLYCHGEPPLADGAAGSAAKMVPSPAEIAAAKPAPSNPVVQSVGPNFAAKTVSINLSLEDDAKAEVTITLDMAKLLRKASPGVVQLDLATVGDRNHHLYFQCPGYATQLVPIVLFDSQTSSAPLKVKLFRTRYVVLRCAFNTHGGRNLAGDGVEEQRIALSHMSRAKYFSQDWWIWQGGPGSGDTAESGAAPRINFNRFVDGFGVVKPPPGVSYENMTVAPESGYRCENLTAEKGLVLYCRVNGNIDKAGLGYGKILVEAVTETLPRDVPILRGPE